VQNPGESLVRLDILALREVGPQLAQEAPVVAAVQVSEDGFDGLGGLLSVVEGDAAGLKVSDDEGRKITG
jgi:hypothetical protein